MNNRELKRQLKFSFNAPAASRKQDFFDSFDYPKASRLDFIKAQAGYIRKRVWIVNVLLFFIALSGTYLLKTPVGIVQGVSSILPFLSLVSITEIAKSASHNMTELEMSCRYSFSQVILARIGLLGSTNLAILSGISLLLIGKTDYGLLRLGTYLLIPFLLTSYVSLFVLNRIDYPGISSKPICSVLKTQKHKI